MIFFAIVITLLLIFISWQLKEILSELKITNKQHEGDMPWYTLLSEDGKSIAQISQENGVRVEELLRLLQTGKIQTW